MLSLRKGQKYFVPLQRKDNKAGFVKLGNLIINVNQLIL